MTTAVHARADAPALLAGFNVTQIGPGLAAAVCGRILADVGAHVTCIEPGSGSALLAYLDHGKRIASGGAFMIKIILSSDFSI